MSTQEKELEKTESCTTNSTCGSDKEAVKAKEEQARLEAEKKAEKSKSGGCGCG